MLVKICGITSEADALLAVALGADAVGFVFAPSPRQVTPQAVDRIINRLPREILTVGVFRDESPKRVVQIMNSIGLTSRPAPRLGVGGRHSVRFRTGPLPHQGVPGGASRHRT